MARALVIFWREAVVTSGLPTSTKMVALALAQRMTPEGEAEVSRAHVAELASASVRTTVDAIQRLEAVGLLRVDRSAGGRHQRNRYQALVPSINGEQPALFNPGKRGRSCTVTDAETVQISTGNGAGSAPVTRTSIEDLSRGRAPAHAEPPSVTNRLSDADGHGRGEGDGYEGAAAAAAAFRRRLAEGGER